MNSVVEEMQEILDSNELMHYGMPRRSGRYPWGSGDDTRKIFANEYIDDRNLII